MSRYQKLLFIIYDKGFKVYLKKLFCCFFSSTSSSALWYHQPQCWGMVPGRLCTGRRYVSPICHRFVPAQWKQLFHFTFPFHIVFSAVWVWEKPLTYSFVAFIFSPFSRGFPPTRHWEARPRNHAVETFVLCLTAVSAHSLIQLFHVNAH